MGELSCGVGVMVYGVVCDDICGSGKFNVNKAKKVSCAVTVAVQSRISCFKHSFSQP